MSSSLPGEVEAFVVRNIRSLVELEVLLWLHQHEAAWWSAETLAEGLGIERDQAERALEKFASLNLLSVKVGSSPSYQFSPVGDAQTSVEQLVDAMRVHRVRIYTLVGANALRTARAFSEAFRLRGEKDRG